MIFIKINVELIDKQRLFDGKKGTYMDCVLIETPNSKYADYMVKQSVTKEERESGVEIVIGDGKIFKKQDPTNFNNPPDALVDNSDGVKPDLPF